MKKVNNKDIKKKIPRGASRVFVVVTEQVHNQWNY